MIESGMMTTRITIVIPVRNDATALARSLDHLAGLRDVAASEIVVAAWGDPDDTERAVAGGDVLFFLHADSFPPPDALQLIAQTLADRRAVGGAFEHLFAERSASLRLITYVNRVRYRITRNYYGDQGIFVRTSVFRELGGYRDLRLLEDLDFAQRLKRRGRSILVREPLRTSGRRFLSRGPWRTFIFIVWLLALHTLGLDAQRYAERWRGPADRTPGMPWSRSDASGHAGGA